MLSFGADQMYLMGPELAWLPAHTLTLDCLRLTPLNKYSIRIITVKSKGIRLRPIRDYLNRSYCGLG